MKNNLNDWNTNDVIMWVKSEINLSDYDYTNFLLNEIDGRDLVDLTEDNLKYDLKILKLHDRKIFLRKICELMNSIVELNINKNEFKNVNLSNLKYLNINFKSDIENLTTSNNCLQAKFKCSYQNKTIEIIQEFLEIFNLSKEDKYVLLDKDGVIIPKESLIFDFINNNQSDTQEIENFNLVLLEKENINKLKSNSLLKNEDKSIVNNNESDINLNKINPNKTKNYSFYNNKKDSFIYETANKNKYLSFDALDHYEKNGYAFSIRKNLSNSLEDISNNPEKEKVTINSYYNISNLNNFNNENSFKSPFTSYENKSANLTNLTISKNSNSLLNNKNNNKNSAKKKNKLSCLNIRSKKNINFDELSDNNEIRNNITSQRINKSNTSGNFIKIEDKSNKLDIDNYINNFISYKNSMCSNNNNQSVTSQISKKLFDKKMNIHNINSNFSENNSEKEIEIENFLKTLKKSSTFILPSETNFHDTDSRLKKYIKETQKYKNTKNIKNSGIRHLIHKNITSSISNEKNMDSSISN